MTLTIPQSDLLALAQVAAQCASRDNSDPAPCHVRLSAGDGTVHLEATDYDHWLHIEAPCEGELPPVMVNAEKLVSAASGLNASTVKIDVDKGSLKLIGGGRRTLPIFDAANAASPTVESPVRAAIDASSLRQALKFCLPHVHDNMVTHGHLCGVRMELVAGKAAALATNGVAVVSIAMAATGDDFAVTLGRRFLDLLSRSAPEIGAVDFEFSDRLVRASWPGGSLLGKMVEGPFPDINRALRKSSANHLSLHAAEMVAALEAIADFGTADRMSRSNIVTLRMNGAVTLRARSGAGEGIEELSASWEGADDYSIAFAATRTSKLLRGFGANPVTIEMNEPDKPMIFRCDALPDRVGAVAPMRV